MANNIPQNNRLNDNSAREVGAFDSVKPAARLLQTLTTEKMLHAYAAGLGVVLMVLLAIWFGVLP